MVSTAVLVYDVWGANGRTCVAVPRAVAEVAVSALAAARVDFTMSVVCQACGWCSTGYTGWAGMGPKIAAHRAEHAEGRL